MEMSIVYFSQTGNTRAVAETMVESFEESGHSVRVVPLKKATSEDTNECELLGVGAPCFHMRAPTPAKNFLRDLPRLNGRPAFVFATSAGAPGRVLYELTYLLRNKGANVIGGFLARGEIYHPTPSLLGRFPGRPNQQDLFKARSFALAAAEHVSAGHTGTLPGSRPDALRSVKGFYQISGLSTTDSLIRIFMPAPKLDTSKCDQCNWCVKECPMDTISMQPYPVIGNDCIRCYRCLTGCPQKAFGADFRFCDPPLGFLFNAKFEHWFGDLEPEETLY